MALYYWLFDRGFKLFKYLAHDDEIANGITFGQIKRQLLPIRAVVGIASQNFANNGAPTVFISYFGFDAENDCLCFAAVFAREGCDLCMKSVRNVSSAELCEKTVIRFGTAKIKWGGLQR